MYSRMMILPSIFNSIMENHNYILIVLSFLIFPYTNGREKVNCKLIKIWGPGLDPQNVIMPARYFFIEYTKYDKSNSSSQQSFGKDKFDIQIFGTEETQCKAWINVLDRKDGSLIVRYKIQEICFNLTISVKCNGEHVLQSPYQFKGTTYPDDCSCQINPSVDDWLKTYGCTKQFPQINSDLSQFESIDFDLLYPVAEERFFQNHGSLSICNYAIQNNKIYRECHGQYTGFKMFMDAILLFITRKVQLPDLELLVNLGDWPLVKKGLNKSDILPVFSWCGSEDTYDIVLPTYDITESSLENMGRVTLDMLSIQGNIAKRWEEKTEKLFWRGRDSSRERLKLILLSRQHNHLINASLTDFFFFRDEESLYGPKEKRISFFKFFDYKYQLNMDGTVAAYRFPYLLVGDSLIFKQHSTYYEHFYKEIKEWKHFIPVKKDLSDLVEKINWATAHDEEARKISLEGQKFARNNLLPQDIFCYHVQLLKEYSKKLVQSVKIRPGMELVKENTQKRCSCITKYPAPRRDHEEL